MARFSWCAEPSHALRPPRNDYTSRPPRLRASIRTTTHRTLSDSEPRRFRADKIPSLSRLARPTEQHARRSNRACGHFWSH
eukprot:9492023-Pyramimonas_sp.AAC.2